MKAKIIEEVIYEGTMDWVHGGGQMVRRLLIEEKNDLCITFFQDQLLAFTGYDLDKHLRNVPSQDDEFGIEQKLAIVLGEVEVPDEEVIETGETIVVTPAGLAYMLGELAHGMYRDNARRITANSKRRE